MHVQHTVARAGRILLAGWQVAAEYAIPAARMKHIWTAVGVTQSLCCW